MCTTADVEIVPLLQTTLSWLEGKRTSQLRLSMMSVNGNSPCEVPESYYEHMSASSFKFHTLDAS